MLDDTSMHDLADQECLKLARIGDIPFLNEEMRMVRIIQAFERIAANFTEIWKDLRLSLSEDPNPNADSNVFSHVHLMVIFNLGWIIEKMPSIYDPAKAPRDLLDRTALHVACELKYVKLTRKFLQIFAATDKARELRDHLKMTPLLTAVCANNFDRR